MNIKKAVLVIGFLVSGITTTTNAMLGNVFLIADYHVRINGAYYKNYGWIKAYDRAELNVYSLTGTGSISANTAKINCLEEYDYAGPITCTAECSIKAPKIVAPYEATIEAPVVILECDEFDFKGTITCDTKCIIYSKTPFKHNKFRTKGKGSVTVIISPYAVETHTAETLIAKVNNTLFYNLLKLTDADIEALPKEILHYIETNTLQQGMIGDQIDKLLTEAISYHKQRLNETTDSQELYKGLKSGSIPALGVALGTLGFIYRENSDDFLEDKFGISRDSAEIITRATLGIGAFATTIAAIIKFSPTVKHLKSWVNPQHKERMEQLEKLKAQFHSAFSVPYVSQQQVTKIR